MSLQEKEYQIWMSGWKNDDHSVPAKLIGTERAASFRDACEKLYAKQPVESKQHWSFDRTSVYSMQLFDNEADANQF